MNDSAIDVLILSHRYDIKGGGEKALLEALEYLVAKGLKTHVIIGDKGNIVDHLNRLGVSYSVTFLPYWAHSKDDPSPFQFTSLNPTVNTMRQIVDLIHELKPKVCLTNTIVVPWLAYAASITKVPHVWMIHELGTAGLNLRYAIGEKETMRSIDMLSDFIIFNSRYTAEYYLPQISSDTPTAVVYPGGSIPKPKQITSPFRRKSSYKMCLVSQIKPQKAQMDAIKAVEILTESGYDTELCIVGLEEDPKYSKKLKAYIVQSNLESNVVMVGHQKNPASYIDVSNVSLMCATNEAFGRVTVEYMLLGKPVIAAASAGTLEIVDEGKTGLLYSPSDPQSLVDKIKWTMEHPNEIKKISKRAKSSAIEKYSDAARFKPLIDTIHRLPNTKKRALDLSMLEASYIDFSRSLQLYDLSVARNTAIETSLLWRLRSKLKKLVGK